MHNAKLIPTGHLITALEAERLRLTGHPFQCPRCGHRVFLRSGGVVSAHFAHAAHIAPNCPRRVDGGPGGNGPHETAPGDVHLRLDSWIELFCNAAAIPKRHFTRNEAIASLLAHAHTTWRREPLVGVSVAAQNLLDALLCADFSSLLRRLISGFPGEELAMSSPAAAAQSIATAVWNLDWDRLPASLIRPLAAQRSMSLTSGMSRLVTPVESISGSIRVFMVGGRPTCGPERGVLRQGVHRSGVILWFDQDTEPLAIARYSDKKGLSYSTTSIRGSQPLHVEPGEAVALFRIDRPDPAWLYLVPVRDTVPQAVHAVGVPPTVGTPKQDGSPKQPQPRASRPAISAPVPRPASSGPRAPHGSSGGATSPEPSNPGSGRAKHPETVSTRSGKEHVGHKNEKGHRSSSLPSPTLPTARGPVRPATAPRLESPPLGRLEKGKKVASPALADLQQHLMGLSKGCEIVLTVRRVKKHYVASWSALTCRVPEAVLTRAMRAETSFRHPVKVLEYSRRWRTVDVAWPAGEKPVRVRLWLPSRR